MDKLEPWHIVLEPTTTYWTETTAPFRDTGWQVARGIDNGTNLPAGERARRRAAAKKVAKRREKRRRTGR